MTRIKYIKKSSKNYCSSFIWFFFGKRLIVPEYYITELGQNHAPPTSDSIILNDSKIQFWKKPLDKILTRSLLSEFGSITDKDNLDKIDIVIGGDHS